MENAHESKVQKQSEDEAALDVNIKRENIANAISSDFISLETSSTSSDTHDNNKDDDVPTTAVAEINEIDSDDESEIDYDEKIKIKEKDISEVDLYLSKLQERRKKLIDDLNHLKEQKALRRSNQLAKRNWENDTFPWNKEIQRTLKKVFKLDSFRPQQLQTINALMSKYDVLLLAPTGGGKSLCYQLSAIVNEGITVVVSPLVALMEDQVWSLKNLGIEAELLSSTTDRNKTNGILKMLAENSDTSVLKLLYITPERMAKSKRFLTALQKSYFAKKLNMIAIDEVHCCSQWGHDFRPDYKFLGTLKQMFPDIPILGVTATATSKVIVDVQKMLNIRDCLVLKAPFNRPNLFYQVMEKPTEKVELYNLLSDLLKRRYAGKSGIIYTFSIKDAEDLAAELVKKAVLPIHITMAKQLELMKQEKQEGVGFSKSVIVGIEARPYHANLTADRRTLVHTKWLRGLIQVVVATVAFGMGIDKPDVRFVIHHTMSKSMENFYQESGRAGRDGKRAECILLYRFIDLAKITTMMFSERTGLQNAYAIADYCIDATRCRRDIISQYFSEVWNDNDCNKMCDRCYNVDSIQVPKMEITEYIFDLYKILEGAEAIDVKLTGTKLIDAWYNKGPTNIRSEDVKAPPLERYYAEQIVVYLILEKYLKEDFHFTAYTTISYIRKGANVPAPDDDILFHGARVLKLPEENEIWGDNADGATSESNKKHKKRKENKDKPDSTSGTPSKGYSKKRKHSDTSSNGEKRTESASSSSASKSNEVTDPSPKRSSNVKKFKERPLMVSDVVQVETKRKILQERERIIKCNKTVVDPTDDVIFVTDEVNVIEIDD